MTGAEIFAQIVDQVNRMVPLMPDESIRRKQIAISVQSAAIMTAARLLEQSRFEQAYDLVKMASQMTANLAAEALQTDDVRDALDDALERLLHGRDPSEGKLVQKTSMSAEELLELGVINDRSDLKVVYDPVLVGIAAQEPYCIQCGPSVPAIALFFAIDESHALISSSLCKRCIDDEYEWLRTDPEMRQVGDVLYVFVPQEPQQQEKP